MGFLDSLFGNTVARHTRRVASRDAQADDREASAAWLAKDGGEEALLGLCQRFNLQVTEHLLKDKKEKDAVIELLVDAGPAGAAASRRFAETSPNFAYAVRVVEAVEGAAKATDLLLELLAYERVEEEFHTEKKRNLLLHLAERKDGRIVSAAERFLADYDEGVRNAAVEAIAAQDGDDGREPLLKALLNRREESTRVRGRIAEIFASRGWGVDADEWFPKNVPSGYRLFEGRLLAGR